MYSKRELCVDYIRLIFLDWQIHQASDQIPAVHPIFGKKHVISVQPAVRRKHETNTEGTALLERPVQPDGIAIGFSQSAYFTLLGTSLS